MKFVKTKKTDGSYSIAFYN